MKNNSTDVLFSIIVPIYNVEKYLDECIQSIINQKFENYELLLIDDGSKDNCPEICDRYAESNSKIKVIHKVNGGLVSARKAGVEHASGRYILNVDGDDCLPPDSLEPLSEIVLMSNADIIAYGFSRYRDGEILGREKNNFNDGMYVGSELELLKSNIISENNKGKINYNIFPSVWSKAIKKDLYCKWQNKTLNTIKMGEDLSVTFPALLESQSVYIYNKDLYYYRTNDASMSFVYNEKEVDNLNTVLDYIKNSIDSDKFCAQHQLDRYAMLRTKKILHTMAKNIKSFNEFKTAANSFCKKGLDKYISRYQSDSSDKGNKLFAFCIKHKLWSLIWLYYHRSN